VLLDVQLHSKSGNPEPSLCTVGWWLLVLLLQLVTVMINYVMHWLVVGVTGSIADRPNWWLVSFSRAVWIVPKSSCSFCSLYHAV